jgi:hypothetical protein
VSYVLLPLEEKRAKQEAYILSELGPLAPATLLWITRAIRGAYLNIVSNRRLVKNVEQDFSAESPYDRESYVNYLNLDTMAKTETIFESFLALIHALAFNQSDLAQSMVWYPSMERKILPRLDAHIFGTKRDEAIRNILSVPWIDKVGDLSSTEIELLSKLTTLSIEKFVDDYTVTRDFYESHLIPYNKMRHGMAVILAMRSNLGRANFAIDLMHKMSRKPPNVIVVHGKLPIGNALAIVPSDERSLNLYERLAKEWDLYTRYIVGSLMAKMFNIGEGYLPCVMRSQGQWTISYIPKIRMSTNEQRIFNGICEKVRPNFLLPDFKSHLEFRFGPKSEPQIQEKIEKYYSATLWYTGEGDETSYEHGWR